MVTWFTYAYMHTYSCVQTALQQTESMRGGRDAHADTLDSQLLMTRTSEGVYGFNPFMPIFMFKVERCQIIRRYGIEAAAEI